VTEHFKFGGFHGVILTAVSLMLAVIAVAGAENGGRVTTLEARLILASDKPDAPPAARRLDAASMKRFYCFYKWTNFFLVKKQRFAVAALATRNAAMTVQVSVLTFDTDGRRLSTNSWISEATLTDERTLTVTNRRAATRRALFPSLV